MGKGYGEYCPIAKASEVIGERWTPLILRNIHLRCHSLAKSSKAARTSPRRCSPSDFALSSATA
jgi:DNA-binding HxlR family transcriptional regulator